MEKTVKEGKRVATGKRVQHSEVQSSEVSESRRSAGRSKAKRAPVQISKKTLLIIVAAVVLVAALCILLPRVIGSKDAALLEGTWAYGDEATYSFDGKRSGRMDVDDMHFEYTYTASDGKLKLNYKDKVVEDATYEFKVFDGQLTLIGGEGTTGGTYQLTRMD